jgi:hypothetical protein
MKDKIIHVASKNWNIVRTKCGLLKDEVYDHTMLPKKATCLECVEQILERDNNRELETIRLLQWQQRLKELKDESISNNSKN